MARKRETGLDRLEKLGRFIRAGEFPKSQGFNMGTWYTKWLTPREDNECGTVACMAGWACAMWPGELKLEGVLIQYPDRLIRYPVLRSGKYENEEALAKFFEINEDEARQLFLCISKRPTDHAYHGQRVLDFVARKRAQSNATTEEREG